MALPTYTRRPPKNTGNKKHYAVYTVAEGIGVYSGKKRYKHVGDTWAVSEAQACNNVRFRNGGGSSFWSVGDRLDEGEVFYYYEAREIN